jgi:peptide/nickel transport system substrate-binding protein
LSGDVDMIEGVRAPGWIPSIQAQKPDLLFDMTAPGSFNTLFFNLTKAPLDNIQVRQAIIHGINREEIVQALAPMANISFTLNPPNYPTGFKHEELPEELRYDYDPDKAKALLADAGFKNGLTIAVNTSQREDYSSYALIIQEQLRAIGVTIDLNIMDHSAYHADNRKDLNSLPINSSSLPPIPLDVYNRITSAAAEVKNDGKGGGNYSHYGVAMPGVDEKLQAMLQATSFDDYVKIGREVELQIQTDLPMFGLPTLSYTVVRSPKIDLGYEVKGGYARWRLHRATIVG